MSKIKLRDRINAIVRNKENADREEFFSADEMELQYILHKDLNRIADETKHTRRWIFLVLVFTFIAVTQIANFFVR